MLDHCPICGAIASNDLLLAAQAVIAHVDNCYSWEDKVLLFNPAPLDDLRVAVQALTQAESQS